MISYYNSSDNLSSYRLGIDLAKHLVSNIKKDNQLIILCIGSDRSTGDCLGPLVGQKLHLCNLPDTNILGTLQNPVHAANIQNTIDLIYDEFENPFILAIDASLGTRKHVGYYTLGEGPLIPGLGVKRTLPAVGDLHITGIVNYSGLFDEMLLQTTRLGFVMKLADNITSGINMAVTRYNHIKSKTYV